jgi:hypothetical protein
MTTFTLPEPTVTDHVMSAYAARIRRFGSQTWEDRADHLRAAVVATSEFLGRPLTAAEILALPDGPELPR